MNVTFATPAMLMGLAAAGIPLVLHLLASVRAPKVVLPTLRFLEVSMERTARRRHVQHWLLLILRSAMLSVLAVAVAEPISRAMGFGGGGSGGAAVIVLDDSMSMAARAGGGSRFEVARSQVTDLLNGDEKPAIAALLTASGPAGAEAGMSAELDNVRRQLSAAAVTGQWAPLADRIGQACQMLAEVTNGVKMIYVFSDLQAISFGDVAELRPPEGAEDVSLVVVDTGGGDVNNVSVAGLEVAGYRVANEMLTVTATLVNSSSASRVVDVVLHVNGQATGQRARVTLGADGEGRRKTVGFRHRIGSAEPISGAVVIETLDDLPEDNVRRFALRPAEGVDVVVVAGPGETDDSPLLQPAGLVELVLNPYDDPADGPIRPRVVAAGDFAPGDLAGAEAAVFCEVPGFTASQAEAIEAFVRNGGTAMFFLGRGVSADNYNDRFSGGDGPGLLPAVLGEAVGEVGPTAAAIASEWVDAEHPYMAGLYATAAEYPPVLVQRYVRLQRTAGASMTLIRLAGGDPLVVAKVYGRGRVVLSAVPASPRWSDMLIRGAGPAMVVRAALTAPQQLGADDTYIAGGAVVIAPQLPDDVDEISKLRVEVFSDRSHAAAAEPLELFEGEGGPAATFTRTATAGVYRWRLLGPGVAEWAECSEGLFVVNPDGVEGDLEVMSPGRLEEALVGRGFGEVTVAPSLGCALERAADRAKGDNWWDVLVVAVIIVLLAEAVIANRSGSGSERSAFGASGGGPGRSG